MRSIRSSWLAGLVALAATSSAPMAEPADLKPGDILAVNETVAAIVSIDGTSGDRALVSGCFFGGSECPSGPRGSGPSFEPTDIAWGPDGNILVLDSTTGPARILRVDPKTGDREVVSGDAGLRGDGIPMGMASRIAVVGTIQPSPSSRSEPSSWGLALVPALLLAVWLHRRGDRSRLEPASALSPTTGSGPRRRACESS